MFLLRLLIMARPLRRRIRWKSLAWRPDRITSGLADTGFGDTTTTVGFTDIGDIAPGAEPSGSAGIGNITRMAGSTPVAIGDN
jgi:hypothetical protein